MKRLLPVLLFVLAQASRAQTGEFKDWLILGTFPAPDATTRLSREYVPHEAEISPRGGEQLGGKSWIIYHSPGDYLDFRTLRFIPNENCALYACVFVHSDFDQHAHLLVGSDDGVVVWCNGQQVHFNNAHRGIRLDQDTVSVLLSKGWNTLLFKVTNDDGGYALSARIADGSGVSITPVNPFPPTSPLSPSRLTIDSATTKGRFVLSRDGRAQFIYSLDIINEGSTPSRDVSVVATTDKQLAESTLPVVEGGEIRTISWDLPIDRALETERSSVPLDILARYDGRETRQASTLSADLLRSFFSPWECAGWNEADSGAISISRSLRVPDELAGFGLELMVDIGDAWGSLSIDGKPRLNRFSGDSGDLQLTEQAAAGDTFHIAIVDLGGKNPGNTILRRATIRPRNAPVERYIYDRRFAKEIYGVDLGDQSEISRQLFSLIRTHQLGRTGEVLKDVNRKIGALAPEAKKLSLHLIGNAHIDMAWLWRYTETMDVAHSTFQAAVDNLKTFPDFTFSHGQAHSYLWIEQTYPELFHQIQEYVKQGRWEIVGGTWVESDANMPSGESLVRQYLYGKRYFMKKFGVDVKHGWQPDTFGHPASLPQILAKSGIETYSFFRPWGEERMFWWQSPDGSKVFAHRPPDWYGTWTGIPDDLWKTAKTTHDTFGVQDVVRFYGIGDHGGGPTRREINKIHDLSHVDVYPQVSISTMDQYYSTLLQEKRNVSVVTGEQNPVFEGCYTSQAMMKANNRKAEALLPTAEMFSAIAMQFGFRYPQQSLEDAWHLILFNQFHDLMCGSGIHAVYVDAAQWYDEAFARADSALNGALRMIASNVSTGSPQRSGIPLLIFNPLNWNRSEPVFAALPFVSKNTRPVVKDETGGIMTTQVVSVGKDSVHFVFVPKDVPSIGYKTYWVEMKGESPEHSSERVRTGAQILENKFFRLMVDQNTGSISELYDKTRGRELIPPGAMANQLVIQNDDAGMSAWVIGLSGVPVPLRSPKTVAIVEDGPVRQTVRTEYEYEASRFTQDITLYATLPRIDFRVAADWHHRKKILKIAFPLNVGGGKATFEIPYGTINRESNGREVVTQKWVDVSTDSFGVSLLNDSKYGCDVRGDTIRLTALRSSTDPDPDADEGYQEFSYALYPHGGTWEDGMTVRHGYEFNTPMIVLPSSRHRGVLKPTFSFLSLDAPDIVLTALKKAEDDDDVVVRCYETAGKATTAKLHTWKPLQSLEETNLMEWEARRIGSGNIGLRFSSVFVAPYEIKTLKMALAAGR